MPKIRPVGSQTPGDRLGRAVGIGGVLLRWLALVVAVLKDDLAVATQFVQ